jgi:hypothetical protein
MRIDAEAACSLEEVQKATSSERKCARESETQRDEGEAEKVGDEEKPWWESEGSEETRTASKASRNTIKPRDGELPAREGSK